MSLPNGLSGLINFGNTCYMNTAIQCLSNIPIFRKYFLKKHFLNDLKVNKKETNLTIQWYKLLLGLWTKNCIITPNTFRQEIRILVFKSGMNMNLLGNGQNDVQEFLLFLLTNLHESLSKKVKMNITGEIKNEMDKCAKEALQSWIKFFKNDYSFIIKNFYSQQVSYIYDLNKNLRSTTYQPVCYYTLPINDDCNSIYDCLDLYVDYEEMDTKYYDEKTKENIDFLKQIKFWNTPNILIIVLKRFNNDGSKIESLIDFPIDELNLNKYCIGYDRNNNKFRLVSISNHIGNLNFGHYYSYVLNSIDNNWYEMNDTNISRIDKDSIITDKSYCLFYQKI